MHPSGSAAGWSRASLAGSFTILFATGCPPSTVTITKPQVNALEDDPTGSPIETLNGTATLESAQLERDPAGGWVAGYIRRAFAADAVVAHDRNGDGDFADANEIVAIEPAGTFSATKSALAVDSAGRVAYAYTSAGANVRLAWDRNGDGDFSDTVTGNPELTTLSGGLIGCFDLAFDAAGHLAVALNSPSGETLRRDLNDDGDFDDPGESLSLGTGVSCPEVATATGQYIAATFSGLLRVDRNGDGDFSDIGEQMNLSSNIWNSGDLKLNGTNRVIAAGLGKMFVGSTGP